MVSTFEGESTAGENLRLGRRGDADFLTVGGACGAAESGRRSPNQTFNLSEMLIGCVFFGGTPFWRIQTRIWGYPKMAHPFAVVLVQLKGAMATWTGY